MAHELPGKERLALRTWKGHDWDTLNRLCEKGFISDPKNRNKSAGLTEEGARRAEELFKRMFGKPE